jgi:hypothetical protein
MAWWLGWPWTPKGESRIPDAVDDGVTLVDEHVLLIRRPKVPAPAL